VSARPAESEALAHKLKVEGERLTEFFSGLSDADWRATVYAEGSTWSVRSVLAHLLTAERAFVILFERIQGGGGGVSEDFAIDRYNASQQRRTQNLSGPELIQQYKEARVRMIDFVKGLASEDLEREGRHPFLGLATLREMVKMIYIHNQTHFRDVRRALEVHGTRN
jgi:uncharacterized damage-inducible protein DinB